MSNLRWLLIILLLGSFASFVAISSPQQIVTSPKYETHKKWSNTSSRCSNPTLTKEFSFIQVVYVSIFSSMFNIICPDPAIIWQVWMHNTIIFFMVQFSFYCIHLPNFDCDYSCIGMCATCSVGNIHWFYGKTCKIFPTLQYACLCVSWDSTISLGGHLFWGHQALQCLQILRLLNNNSLEMYTKHNSRRLVSRNNTNNGLN